MMQYKGFGLKFRNTQNGESKIFQFIIEEHDLAQRWADMLRELLEKNNPLEKNFLLHGWRNTARNLDFLCREINRHIETINLHFSPSPAGLRYHIAQVFSSETVNQEELNKIHHEFEVLIGQVWNVSEYFKSAPANVQHSIRQLNNLCHEIENLIRAQHWYDLGRCHSHIIAAYFQKTTVPLLPEDRKYFSLYHEFGNVNLHYAQLGKTHMEAYHDKDENIHDSNISGLRYLSGEFDITFSDGPPMDAFERDSAAIKNWLMSKGVNPEEQNLGLAKVAFLDRSYFPGMTTFQIMQELFKYDDICEVILKSGDHIYSQTYDYLWNDDGIEKQQINLLKMPESESELEKKPARLSWLQKLIGFLKPNFGFNAKLK